MTATATDELESDQRGSIFKDIRRYYCEFCGICRSKKILIKTHIKSHHQDEVKEAEEEKGGGDGVKVKMNVCEECGVGFKKPAHLKQHMQSHSLERPFVCHISDCQMSFRRKDHLNRHLIQHQGKLFKCTVKDCDKEFSVQSNMKRHIKFMHELKPICDGVQEKKKFVCQEVGCGKEFLYESRLRKHEDSHVTLDSVELFCNYPGCNKPFSNKKCLKAHLDSCHQYVTCEDCGCQYLRKNIQRHLRQHHSNHIDGSPERIKCTFEDCGRTYSQKSNLQQHIRTVHHKHRRFACSVHGCGMRFTLKHVRDNHEKSACHNYIHGDFEELDEELRSRPRGGCKRKYPSTEMLSRKRVCSPCEPDPDMDDGLDYVSWMLSPDDSSQ